jgi:hypothetical protein
VGKPRAEKDRGFLMDFFAVDAVANHVEADLLAGLNRRVDLFQLVGGPAAYHRPAQIAEIAAFLGAREDVEDDRAVRLTGPLPS